MTTPVIFVGSSSEARDVDIRVRFHLEEGGAHVLSWRDVFKSGQYRLDALQAVASQVDGALLIATNDDVVTFRGSEFPAPRDNIVVELGFFTACLGRLRAGLVHVRLADVPELKLPSDLEGLTVIVFDPVRDAANERALREWLDRVRTAASSRAGAWRYIRQTSELIEATPDSWIPFVCDTLLRRHLQALSAAAKGTIELTAAEYYRLINLEMSSGTPLTHVRAVASLSPARWVHSEDQRGYVDTNVAAAGRGVRIRRLFVLPGDGLASVADIAKRMSRSGIAVRSARPGGPWEEIHKIQDMVMFTDTGPIGSRVYIAYPDRDYPVRIASAEVIVDQLLCQERADLFDSLWDWAADIQTADSTAVSESPSRATPPGHALTKQYLKRPVITCDEAAAAKRIPLGAELKTLILETSVGVVAVHVPGDHTISLRAVKRALKCREARLASRVKLSTLGLAPGTISPVLEPVWYMQHLVCESVLLRETVSTNSGTLTGYFKFKPDLLLGATKVTVGRFSFPSKDRTW